MIRNIASVLIHGSSFVKVSDRFVAFMQDEHIARDLLFTPYDEVKPSPIFVNDKESFVNWFEKSLAFQKACSALFKRIFLYSPEDILDETPESRQQMLTKMSLCGPASRILSIEDYWFLQYHISDLPEMENDTFYTLYSTRHDGTSWRSFAHKLTNERFSTFIFVKDSDGHVFGSFTGNRWRISPEWFGDKNCALFSLLPKMQWFRPTGYNHNFQVSL